MYVIRHKVNHTLKLRVEYVTQEECLRAAEGGLLLLLVMLELDCHLLSVVEDHVYGVREASRHDFVEYLLACL